MPAPLGESQLVEIGRALLFGGSGLIVLLIFVGVAAYLFLCARSTRVWDGAEHRWRRP